MQLAVNEAFLNVRIGRFAFLNFVKYFFVLARINLN